jgi:hypothetical protein
VNSEEMIKHAFEQQAGRAGDHRAVLAEVTRRTSARRRGGALGITLITAGVAAAVVTPVVLFSGGAQPTTTDPAASAQIPATSTAELRTSLLTYQPTWLPDGLVETGRHFTEDMTFSRTWCTPGAPEGGGNTPKIDFAITKQAALPQRDNFPAGIENIDINGKPGHILGQNHAKPEFPQALVEWMVAPGHLATISVDGMQNVDEIALRMARSVQNDAKVPFVRSIAFGWLPSNMTQGMFSVRGTSPSDVWILADTEMDKQSRATQKRVSVQIDRDKPGDNGTPTTVRGKQGIYIPSTEHPGYGEIWVPLGDDKWLEVSGELSQADLIKVADTLVISDKAEFPWIGRR